MPTTDVSVGTNLRTKLIARVMVALVGLFGVGLAAVGYIGFRQSEIASSESIGTTITLSGIIQVVAMEATAIEVSDQVYLQTDDQHLLLTIPNTLKMPKPGSSVSVSGQLRDDGLFQVSTITAAVEVKAPAPLAAHAVSTPTTTATEHKVLVVMGYYPGHDAPTSPTTSDAQAVMFGSSPSVADYYHDNSFGNVAISGTVIGWVPLSGPETSDIWGSTSMALQAAKVANPSLNLQQFQHVVLISPYTATNLPDGYSVIGQIRVSSPDGYVYVGAEMIRSTVVKLPRSTALLPYTIIHEFGHGLGLGHAGLLGCVDVPIATSCRISEYADRFDVMGGAYELPGAEDLNAVHLDELGWLSDTNLKTVDVSTGGTFTLEPIENRTTGLKALAIPRGGWDTLYVEYRQPIGYDTVLDDPTAFTGALLHTYDTGAYSNSYSVASDSLLIDPTPPALFRQNSLTVGTSFTDPATGVVLTATAQDANGITIQVTPASHPIYADLKLLNPVSSTTYSGGSVAFGGMAYSPYGIDRVEYYLADATTPFATSTTPPYYTSTLDVSGYANNSTIQAYMLSVDNVGTRTSTAPISFVVTNTHIVPDTTPPTASVTLPTDGATLSSLVVFRATLTDDQGIAAARYYIDCPETSAIADCAHTTVSSPYLLTKYLLSGSHTVRVAADDNAHHTTVSSTIHFRVDNSNPWVSLREPSSLALVSKTVTLSATSGDDLGIDHVSFYVAGKSVGGAKTSPYTYAWDSTKVSDGMYNWYAVAYDQAGKSTSSPWQILTVHNAVATTPSTPPPNPPTPVIVPPPGASLLGATSGNTITGQTAILRVESDPKYIVKAELQVDGKPVTTKAKAPFTFPIDSPAYPNGTHTLAVVMTLSNNQVATKQFTIVTKNAVSLSVATPKKNATVKKTITITPRIRGGYGAAKMEYLLDGKRLILKRTAPFSYSWNTRTKKTGWHTLTVRVTDKKGKVASTSRRLKIVR